MKIGVLNDEGLRYVDAHRLEGHKLHELALFLGVSEDSLFHDYIVTAECLAIEFWRRLFLGYQTNFLRGIIELHHLHDFLPNELLRLSKPIKKVLQVH